MKPTPRTERELADLHPDLRMRVRALLEAAPMRVGITSAWRSRMEQQRLYDGWKKRLPGFNPANPPGMSRHEDTLDGEPASNACDLAYPPGTARAAAVRWVHANAKHYGLHFPIRREDWHAESNGRPYPEDDGDMTPAEKLLLAQTAQGVEEIKTMLTALVRPRRPDKGDHDPKAVDLGDVLTKIEKETP